MTDHLHLRVLGQVGQDTLYLGLTRWGNYTCCECRHGGCAISVYRDREDAEGYAATRLEPEGAAAREYWERHR